MITAHYERDARFDCHFSGESQVWELRFVSSLEAESEGGYKQTRLTLIQFFQSGTVELYILEIPEAKEKIILKLIYLVIFH